MLGLLEWFFGDMCADWDTVWSFSCYDGCKPKSYRVERRRDTGKLRGFATEYPGNPSLESTMSGDPYDIMNHAERVKRTTREWAGGWVVPQAPVPDVMSELLELKAEVQSLRKQISVFQQAD